MRRRSTGAVSLGLGSLVAAWAFGSMPLAVVGLGFALAGLLAAGWVRVADRSIEVDRTHVGGGLVEGGDLVVEVEARHTGRLLLGSIAVGQQLGGVRHEVRLRHGRAEIVFPALPRGRHRLAPLDVVLADPLGLERAERRFGRESSVLVRPRVPVLDSVFARAGARDVGAARSRFRRPTGFEIHAVRDYAPGEPLRAVHWPTTARRGRLMVKELDDAPRDDLVVVLDRDPAGVAGPPGRSSFDAAVRAAGALVLAHVRWARRVALVGTEPAAEAVHVHSPGRDWELALDALAEAQPIEGADVRLALGRPVPAVSRAREIVVVTGRPERAVEALLALRSGGRSVALVAVAPETFAGRPRGRPEPEVLRAASLGIPVAVVSAGAPLEEALAGRPAVVVGA